MPFLRTEELMRYTIESARRVRYEQAGAGWNFFYTADSTYFTADSTKITADTWSIVYLVGADGSYLTGADGSILTGLR